MLILCVRKYQNLISEFAMPRQQCKSIKQSKLLLIIKQNIFGDNVKIILQTTTISVFEI